MNLEKQVCSLELAKKLKELGVKQESLFYRVDDFILYKTSTGYYTEKGAGFDLGLYNRQEKTNSQLYSAFTVAELGEMLPKQWVSVRMNKDEWVILNIDKVKRHKEFIVAAYAKTEADARAKMLIYLKENKLI